MYKQLTQKSKDISQSIARIFLTLSIFLYSLFFQEHIVSEEFSAPLYSFALAYLIFTLFHYFWLRIDSRELFYRRLITIVGDLSILSFSFLYDSHYASFFYPLYLWIIIGNGIRFGPPYLFTALLIGFIEFAFVIYSNPFWSGENLFLGFGLLFSIIVLPLFYLSLIKRLHDDNRGLTHQVKETEHQATYDFLTNIPNRSHFIKTIHTCEMQKEKISLFFIDLDGFKEVNDHFGHDVGDIVLQEVAKRLKEIAHNDFFLARLGGDEFTLIIQKQEIPYLKTVAKKILIALSKPYHKERIKTISASIGIALSHFDESSYVDLLHHSDKAMYQAKYNGKNQYFMDKDITR